MVWGDCLGAFREEDSQALHRQSVARCYDHDHHEMLLCSGGFAGKCYQLASECTTSREDVHTMKVEMVSIHPFLSLSVVSDMAYA